ncbi:uncharacterized protein BJ212DRAFT_1479144 [Suillus subaureus]|uniref:Uncharacterized protein n=1 Tax=Suillus subaureus TaxID=48587 RepID=A0A9P7EEM9_9AGAM|nr:uncharacterized protein BJ212DRAFT_1479144 [Suillus subaureus]KAG1819015.1 hypothetical protein BJ212DRAFT_1479144 [Suillus subaureus]
MLLWTFHMLLRKSSHTLHQSSQPLEVLQTLLDHHRTSSEMKCTYSEQDGKIDTLQCLHEGLRREIVDRHPAFPLPEPPANVTSLLLDQSVPPSMSPSASALPPLIDLSIGEMTTTPLKSEDASAIEGLLFEYNQCDNHTSARRI